MRGLDPSLATTAIPAAAVVLLGAGTAFASYEQPLALVLAVVRRRVRAGRSGLVGSGWSIGARSRHRGRRRGPRRLRRRRPAGSVWASLASVGLTTAFAAVAFGSGDRRRRPERARGPAHCWAAWRRRSSAALAGWTLADLVGLPEVWRAAPLVLVLGLVAILRPPAGDRGRRRRQPRPPSASPAPGRRTRPRPPRAAYLTLGGALLVGVVGGQRRPAVARLGGRRAARRRHLGTALGRRGEDPGGLHDALGAGAADGRAGPPRGATATPTPGPRSPRGCCWPPSRRW